MKAITFYLPQYSPNEMNDLWWGKGFTEWSYVAQGKPLYEGHYQPKIPSDLGFYDLRLKESMLAQQNLAKQYGIYGFCYYHYWFNGELMLHEPIMKLLECRDLDQPFCFCWANENWSRTWDGQDSEVLMKIDDNKYSPEEHIQWLVKFFKDDRYIKINGKPLFIIHKPRNFSDIKLRINQIRELVKKNGLIDAYIVAMEWGCFNSDELINYGYDAVYDRTPGPEIEFARTNECAIPTVKTYSYVDVAKYYINKEYDNKIRTFPCIFPSWDTTARKILDATIIQNEDSELYKEWLTSCIDKVKKYPEDEQIIFINAWNEWGEGSYLEPDIRNGRKFLEATLEVVEGTSSKNLTKYKSISERSKEYNRVNCNYCLDKDREVFIWGTGVYGQRYSEFLKEKKICINGYIDNDERKWGSQVRGQSVIPPKMLKDKKNKPFIFICSMYYKHIMIQLKEMNYIENIDFVVSNDDFLIIENEKEYKFIYKYFEKYIDVDFEKWIRSICEKEFLYNSELHGENPKIKVINIESRHFFNESDTFDRRYDYIVYKCNEESREESDNILMIIKKLKIMGKIIFINRREKDSEFDEFKEYVIEESRIYNRKYDYEVIIYQRK
ncbi:glycoside hydrolase family 99-like domain-containing protein [Clostridium bornimense]|uniref:glycosyltransferase WbsX family protein n=1 Tax=Clostridium bornimense TaxID=1216932 RepID=UPI001C1173F2|nr:glycoside hydrolase family 99-like domain-containing protein [Clostridium bornimense]MBU5314787.1 glycoside hydrolase family 99-like domain-containing protein [Clostridium bornimense]